MNYDQVSYVWFVSLQFCYSTLQVNSVSLKKNILHLKFLKNINCSLKELNILQYLVIQTIHNFIKNSAGVGMPNEMYMQAHCKAQYVFCHNHHGTQ